ncbi:hypothetical protein [Lacimicrobium alkaliphilum]|uniref:Uncharacterized protein n=1 Tax=Lacimicrobium alkaliphilum TaxID=1526571 RepID=A0ABQ1RLH7_9ALTE|nr:hypothetical protein [Lacimicrobium alkaliphilum]GGD73911.1 hypothetical protein GCM10011357_31190 [Lacimicrobium alkaliphilum]
MNKPMDWLIYSITVAAITCAAFFLAAQDTVFSSLGWLVFVGVFLYLILHNPATFFRRGLVTVISLGLTNTLVLRLLLDFLNLTPQNTGKGLQQVLDYLSPFTQSPAFFYIFTFFGIAALLEMFVNHNPLMDRLFGRQLPLECSATQTSDWALDKVLDNTSVEYFRVTGYIEIRNNTAKTVNLDHTNVSLSLPLVHIWSWQLKQPQCFDTQTDQVYDPSIPIEGHKTTSVQLHYKFRSKRVKLLVLLPFINRLRTTLCFNQGVSQPYHVTGQARIIRQQ